MRKIESVDIRLVSIYFPCYWFDFASKKIPARTLSDIYKERRNRFLYFEYQMHHSHLHLFNESSDDKRDLLFIPLRLVFLEHQEQPQQSFRKLISIQIPRRLHWNRTPTANPKLMHRYLNFKFECLINRFESETEVQR